MANTNAMIQLIDKIESFFPNEADMPTLQDLKNPTSAMVYKFLGRALYEFSIDIDTLKMAHYSQSMCSNYPENYTEIIPYLNLYEIYRKIFDTADIKVEFSMRDILQPRPNRNVKVLNAVMDFLIFADQHVNEMAPIFDEVRLAKEKKVQIEAAKQMLQRKIHEAMHRRKLQDEKKQELTEKLECLKGQLDGKHEQRDELDKLKEQQIALLKESEHRLAKASVSLKEMNEEREKISARIVDSPQHIISSIENQRKKRAESSKKLELLGQNIASVKAQNSHLSSLLGILKEKSKKMKQAQALCKTICTLEAKLKEETDNLDSLERAQKEMEKRQATVQKKQETIEQSEKEMCDANEETLQNLTLKLDEKKEILKSQTKSTEESSSACKKLEAELDSVTSELKKLREDCNTVMQVLVAKHDEINDKRSKLITSIKQSSCV